MVPTDRREAVASLLLRLRTAGIMDARLFRAFEAVPRQNFVPLIFLDDSYGRGAFPIECGQIMSAADQVARSLLALAVSERHRVLEIGTGTGYQAALLAHLGAKITSLERYRTLVEKARTRLTALKIANVLVTHADGREGMPGQLFDRIIVNGAIDAMTPALTDQLASNGMMIAPLGSGDGEQMLTRLTKTGSRLETEELFKVRMQPLMAGVSQAI